MFCDKCGKPATYHKVRVINGYKTEEHLCTECLAEERHTEPFRMATIGEFFDFPSSIYKRRKNTTYICPNCGYTSQEFLETGKLRCSECYQAMRSVVDPVINRILVDEGNTIDKISLKKDGQVLPKANPLDSLKEELKFAVEQERYEDAARLKKQIDEYNKDKGE